ncbi:MAG: hypothetical protein Ct9H300mP16_19280 [Pseudomonadota bacterium]|nr:MAG: hypothetical protein Ct9H300mP16_19280 [Pseudomonadota bacterium]
MKPDPNSVHTRFDTLRDMMGDPSELAVRKSITKLDKHCREFIRRSPFVCIGTFDGQGKNRHQPQRGPAGFCPGTGRPNALHTGPAREQPTGLDVQSDSEPAIALLFMIPGFNETLRVNGQAVVVQDDVLNEKSSINDKKPQGRYPGVLSIRLFYIAPKRLSVQSYGNRKAGRTGRKCRRSARSSSNRRRRQEKM